MSEEIIETDNYEVGMLWIYEDENKVVRGIWELMSRIGKKLKWGKKDFTHEEAQLFSSKHLPASVILNMNYQKMKKQWEKEERKE